MIDVGRLKPVDQWDQTLIEDLLTNKLYPTGIDFRWHEGYPESEGCILIIPARYYSDQTDKITDALSKYRWVLGMVTSDEESLFEHGRVKHGNARWWLQTPRADRWYGDARLFGVGYSPHFRDLPVEPPVKDVDVFLAAQRSNGRSGRHFKVHERRNKLFKVLKRGSWVSDLVERDGFAQGDRSEYVAGMLRAKIAPAPSGAVSPDSFRLWEALAAHCVPIADHQSPEYDSNGYWQKVCPDGAPFPVYGDIGVVPSFIDDALKDWPADANRCAAWFMRYKRSLAMGLRNDLQALGAL